MTFNSLNLDLLPLAPVKFLQANPCIIESAADKRQIRFKYKADAAKAYENGTPRCI